jgi:hypothetical protein
MTGEQKTAVWIVALLVAVAIFIIGSTTYYYHQKDLRQAARGSANVDIVCTVKTPAKETP